jgi:hypothetical protein
VDLAGERAKGPDHGSRGLVAPGDRALVGRSKLDYHGKTMSQKRAGRTVKVSVSLDKEDVAALKRHAKEAFDGNLSAAFAHAARLIRQREARRRLIDTLGGPTLTAESAAAIETEQNGGPPYAPRKSRRTRAA